MKFTVLVLLAFLNALSLGADQMCRCTHFPWRPKECVPKCRAKALNNASQDDLVSLGLAPAIADKIIAARKQKSLQDVTDLEDQLSPMEYEMLLKQLDQVPEARLAAFFDNRQNFTLTSQEALERAERDGKLSEGKILYETVISEDKVRFGFDSADLSPETKRELDQFAKDLKAQDKPVYIEIQGHTDSVGTEKYNEELGLLMAEKVLRYLSQSYGIPVQRMKAVSYGETASVADNSTREGRARNRRIVLVVLQ